MEPTSTREQEFQSWWKDQRDRVEEGSGLRLDPNADAPAHHYDYRAAFNAGAEPTAESGWHWPSAYKAETHPNRFVNGVDTITGQPQTQSPNMTYPARELLDPRIPLQGQESAQTLPGGYARPEHSNMNQEALINAFNNAGSPTARDSLRGVIEDRAAKNYDPGLTTAEPEADKYTGWNPFRILSDAMSGATSGR